MKCKACGYENKDEEATVCGMCSALLKEKPQPAAPPPEPPAKGEEAPTPAQAEAENEVVMDTEPETEPMSMKAQILYGLAMVAGGAATAGLCVGYVTMRVKGGAERVMIPTKIIMLGIGVAVLGLFFMLSGGRVKQVFADPNVNLSAIKWYEWLFLIVATGIGVYIMFQIESYLENLGYSRY